MSKRTIFAAGFVVSMLLGAPASGLAQPPAPEPAASATAAPEAPAVAATPPVTDEATTTPAAETPDATPPTAARYREAPVNAYDDPRWIRRFWEDRDRAIEQLPEGTHEPKSKLAAPGALAVGIIALAASPISLFAGVSQTVGAMGGIWDCDGSSEPNCVSDRDAQRTLGGLGILGGVLGVATGIGLTVFGATDRVWYDPYGNPIPTVEELRSASEPQLRIDVAAGPGGIALRGAW